MLDWTLVIAGPIVARISPKELEVSFETLTSMVEQSGLNVIFATYLDQVPPKSEKYPFTFVTLNDPGPDLFDTKFKMTDGERNRNSSRVLASTRFGISKVKTDFAIKSRIELIPQSFEFIAGLQRIQEMFEESPELKLSTLGSHYLGTGNNYKDAYLWIPDTIQFMRSVDMLALWKTAEEFWLEYRDLWMRRHRFTIATEQVLGLAFAKLFGSGYPAARVGSFTRITLNRHIYTNICDWEKRNIYTLKAMQLGLPVNRFTSFELERKHVDLPLTPREKVPNYFLFKIRHLRKVSWINRVRMKYRILTLGFWKSFFK